MDRVLIVGAAIALAYLRLLSEGDTLRASIVVGHFQQWWNSYRNIYDAAHPGWTPSGRVTVNGRIDQSTANALVDALDVTSLVPDLTAGRDVSYTPDAAGMIAFFRTKVAPPSSPTARFWDAYRIAKRTRVTDVASVIEAWAFGFIEGLEDALPDVLESAAGGTGPIIPIQPAIDVFAIGERRRTVIPWGWVLAGTLVLGAGAGFYYTGRKKRRR